MAGEVSDPCGSPWPDFDTLLQFAGALQSCHKLHSGNSLPPLQRMTMPHQEAEPGPRLHGRQAGGHRAGRPLAVPGPPLAARRRLAPPTTAGAPSWAAS